ncbi:MAG: DUF456 domain-containing protein [Bacteroidales bacterium]|nr:DUF456 domain-containing protein [Bacteroidales bacterium]
MSTATILILIAIFMAVVGFVGAIIPGIPGTPLSFVGLLLLFFIPEVDYSSTFIWTMGLLAAIITVLDYVIPIYGTKKFGGTKMGVRGSTIGMIVSIIILPLLGIVIGPFGIGGIILGPFLGAYIGEIMAGNSENAFRSAIGSFLGFLAGTFIKIVYGIVVLVYVVKDVVDYYFF